MNDNYDHDVGDQVIRETVELIQKVLATKGSLFHRSGDELLVLLPNFDDGEATSVADRIRREIKEHEFSTVGTGVITATLGISTYPTTCTQGDDLKVSADRAAMQGKKEGKDLIAHARIVDES